MLEISRCLQFPFNKVTKSMTGDTTDKFVILIIFAAFLINKVMNNC